MPPDVVDIALGFDGGYAPHAAAVIASVTRRAPGGRFRFIVLCADVDENLQQRLQAVAPEAEFIWRHVGLDDLPAFADRSHFTRATLFRLGLEKLAPPDCRRVIYLDADLTVTGDIRELWNVDIGDRLIGGVNDDDVDADAFAARWNLRPGDGYFNAGVLLIDLERIRAERIFSAAAAFVAKYDEDLPWNDQDALNWACSNRWFKLDRAWNVQRSTAIACANEGANLLGGGAPKIVHYTGWEKPWVVAAYHPWAWLYWRSLSQAGMRRAVARANGFTKADLLRVWLRWRRRRPRGLKPAGTSPAAGRSRSASAVADPVDVSLVICTRNRAAQLETCLQAVRKLRFDGTWELVVVDNGSTDATSAVIDAARRGMTGPVVKVVEPTPGLGQARNAGIAAARGRIVVFTDDDCYVDPDYLTQAVRAFDDERVGYATGRVELHDPTDAPVTVNFSRTPKRYPARKYVHSDGIIGANLAFRRSVLAQISGFDTCMGAGTTFPGGEDVDAAARAGSAGWDGVYRPEMVVQHHHGRKEVDVARLYKGYDMGRGAYTVKYLLRGELVTFLKGAASIRWRMGPISKWRIATFSTPMWELYGAVGYAWVRLKKLAFGGWTPSSRL